MFNAEQEQLLLELLDEYTTRLQAIEDSPDRLTDWVSDQVGLAHQVRNQITRPTKEVDPDLERLLTEEDEIETYEQFRREVTRLTGQECKISFVAWRESPLNKVRK